jgi:hypothetical protein
MTMPSSRGKHKSSSLLSLTGGGSLGVKQGTRYVGALFVSARSASGSEHWCKVGLNPGHLRKAYPYSGWMLRTSETCLIPKLLSSHLHPTPKLNPQTKPLPRKLQSEVRAIFGRIPDRRGDQPRFELTSHSYRKVKLKGLVGRRANHNGRTAGSLLTAAMKLSYWACFALCAFLLCKPTYAQDRSEFWPEFDTYVNLSSRTRLFFLAALSSDQDTKNVQAEFGPNIDFFVRPFARVRLRDADPSKSKLLTLRVGYRYLPTLRGTGGTENRGVVELTPRSTCLLTFF